MREPLILFTINVHNFTFSLAAHGSGERRARCEQKKTTRGWGRVCFSLSSLAPHSTIRTPGTGFLRSSKKDVLYMPPSVNVLVLRSLREEVSYFLFLLQQRKKETSAPRLVLEYTRVPNSSWSTFIYSKYFENGPLEPEYFQRPCSQATFRVIPNQTFSLSISSSSRACSCSCSITKSFS